MDRRQFVKAGVAASLATTLPAVAEPLKQKQQPNVLYVFSDQHRAVSLPGEPFNEAHAPHIDAFRRANFSMDTCVSNYPLCTPYRGILMTGRYPQQSGLIDNGPTMVMQPSEHTLTKTFKAAGYRTGYVGKWHLAGGEDGGFTPKGPFRFDIDDWHIWDETNKHYSSWTYDQDTGAKISPEGWSPITMTDQAGVFLKARAAEPEKPWLLMVSWNPPHPPFDPPENDQAPYAGMLKRRPNVMIPAAGASESLPTEESLHKAMQGYYGGITGVDEQFARLLKMLDDNGQATNTIVIYTSDHGEMMASQGRMAKTVPFEESCRVPFAVRHPGTIQRGQSKGLFAAIDIYPTVCGLAGVPIPPHCEGINFAGVMTSGKGAPRDIVFLMGGADKGDKGGPVRAVEEDGNAQGGDAQAEHAAGAPAGKMKHAGRPQGGGGGKRNGKFTPATPYRGCRTDTHTYAVTEQGRWLLYDNVADPYQQRNLIDDPVQKALMESLDAKIHAWMQHTGDKFRYPATFA